MSLVSSWSLCWSCFPSALRVFSHACQFSCPLMFRQPSPSSHPVASAIQIILGFPILGERIDLDP